MIEILPDRDGTPEEIVRRGIQIIFPDDWVASNPGPVEEYFKRGLVNPISTENALRQGQAVFGFSTYDRLPHISCPTLVACGTADVLVPPGNSRILAERIPGASRGIPRRGSRFHRAVIR